MAVSDRWHKTFPKDGEARCGEHRGKVPTSVHGTGKRWQVRYRDDSGAQKAVRFERLADAERFSTKTQRQLDTGSYLDVRAGKVTLAEFTRDQWLPAQLHIRRNTALGYQQQLKAHILPRLGKRQLAAIRRSDIISFVGALSATPSGRTGKPLKPSTIHVIVAILSTILESAVTDRLIPGNPAHRVPLPRIERPEVQPIPKATVLALAGSITPRYRVAVMLAALAGLRQGEAFGLRVDDVDFLRRRIRVRQQAQYGAAAPLKTRSSVRVIPADDLLLEEIAEHLRLFPSAAGMIVVNGQGRTPKRDLFGKAWRAAVRDAGAPKGTRFHGLRHFYASVLIQANLNPKVIMTRMGHSSIAMTMDVYGHLFPDAEELGRGVFDGLFGDVDVHPECTGTESG